MSEFSLDLNEDQIQLQKWVHDADKWEALSVADQEQVMGRRKADSVELEHKPDDSHVASTDQDRLGKIFQEIMITHYSVLRRHECCGSCVLCILRFSGGSQNRAKLDGPRSSANCR